MVIPALCSNVGMLEIPILCSNVAMSKMATWDTIQSLLKELKLSMKKKLFQS